MNTIDSDITVGELIRKVSDKLLESREERIRAGQPPVFEVDALDVEISFVVTASKSGSGGVDLKVLRGDLSKSHEDQAVQKVVVHLKATSLKPGEHEFEDFDVSTPLRPRRRFDDKMQERGRRLYTAYAAEFREHFEHGYLKELLPYPHFVAWRHEISNRRAKKPPYNPNRLDSHADVTDESTWGTWQEALAALSTGYYQGIGFVFAKRGKTPDPFIGVDLDHCVDTNRSIHKWARDIRDFLKTHGHYSPGDGVHFICEGVLPGPGRKFGSLEFFDRDHYLTLTPHPLPETPRTIESAQVEIGYLYLMQIAREQTPPRPHGSSNFLKRHAPVGTETN